MIKNSTSSTLKNDIDLNLVIELIRKKISSILVFTLICASLATYYSFNIPNIYSSKSVLVVNQTDDSSLGNSQLSGVAALAGINIGRSTNDKSQQAIELLKSEFYISNLIDKYNLKYLLIAMKEASLAKKISAKFTDGSSNGQITNILEEGIGNYQATKEYSKNDMYKILKGITEIKENKSTGFIILKINHHVPEVARYLNDLIIDDLNMYFSELAVSNAKRKIRYLESKLSLTDNNEMKKIFFNMMENQSKVLLMSENSNEYLFIRLVPPLVPKVKSNPNRILIISFAIFLSLMLSVLFVIFKDRFYLGYSNKIKISDDFR